MRRIISVISTAFLLSALAGCFVINVNLTRQNEPLQEQTIAKGGKGKGKILLLDLTGIITSEEGRSIVGAPKEPGMLALMREQLNKAREDGSVRALVVRINSPGGGVTASDTLYHELKKFKTETGVRIVAHFLDTGASGAYYAALAADRITAQPTTITGSIGVTMLRVDATGLMQKIGIEALHISSGPQKGMGSPFRSITDEETKIFQSMIDALHSKFVSVVQEERKIDREKVADLADGRVYTSYEAKDLGLIDDIGYLDDAFTLAGKLANLDQPEIVTYLRPGDFRPTVYSMNFNVMNLNLPDFAGPGIKFTYLWMP